MVRGTVWWERDWLGETAHTPPASASPAARSPAPGDRIAARRFVPFANGSGKTWLRATLAPRNWGHGWIWRRRRPGRGSWVSRQCDRPAAFRGFRRQRSRHRPSRGRTPMPGAFIGARSAIRRAAHPADAPRRGPADGWRLRANGRGAVMAGSIFAGRKSDSGGRIYFSKDTSNRSARVACTSRNTEASMPIWSIVARTEPHEDFP